MGKHYYVHIAMYNNYCKITDTYPPLPLRGTCLCRLYTCTCTCIEPYSKMYVICEQKITDNDGIHGGMYTDQQTLPSSLLPPRQRVCIPVDVAMWLVCRSQSLHVLSHDAVSTLVPSWGTGNVPGFSILHYIHVHVHLQCIMHSAHTCHVHVC